MEIKKLTKLSEINKYANWFSSKWGISLCAYLESMKESIEKKKAVPSWFLAFDGSLIAGGVGIIANDFHEHKDLTPNICALFVEEAYRGKGLAGELLQTACDECLKDGIKKVYLLTDHKRFYERYGWKFYADVKNENEDSASRLYIKKISPKSNYKEMVYQYLKLIPKGRVSTYGDVAAYLGNKKLARVVGNILHDNPDPIGQPCFKIVNSEGRLSSVFGGDGPDLQKARLEKDGVTVTNYHVDLSKYRWKIGR